MRARSFICNHSLIRSRIRVVRNSLTRSRSRGHTESDMTAELNAEYMDEVKKMIPLGRLGYASEVAGMCAFLVRPATKTRNPKP